MSANFPFRPPTFYIEHKHLILVFWMPQRALKTSKLGMEGPRLYACSYFIEYIPLVANLKDETAFLSQGRNKERLKWDQQRIYPRSSSSWQLWGLPGVWKKKRIGVRKEKQHTKKRMYSFIVCINRFWLKLVGFYILDNAFSFGAKNFQGWLESRCELFLKTLS